jgi:hypothetical protein
MATNFLFAGYSKSDQSHPVLTQSEYQTSTLAVHSPECPVANFRIFTSIIDTENRIVIKSCEISQREAVLGHIRRVFRGIELDLHDLM